MYIKSAVLNGEPFTRSYIYHSEIMNGGILEFEMSSEPNKLWASLDSNLPISSIDEDKIVAVPYVHSGNRTFSNQNTIELKTWDAEADIYFTLDGSDVSVKSNLYLEPISINDSKILKAISVKNGLISKQIEAEFTKTPKGRSIKLLTQYGSQYSAGGDKALIDYLRGPNNYMTGSWQGYEGVNLEAIIDLGKMTSFSELSTGFLQDWNAWIFMPEWVDYYASNDGQNFHKLGRVLNDVDERNSDVIIKDFNLKTNTKTRYIKVIAKNRKFNPEWHRAPGGTCWIFADEISVN